MAKEFRCAVLKPVESREPSLGCNSSASSTPRELSTSFTKKLNTFLAGEVEPEQASGLVEVGTSIGK